MHLSACQVGCNGIVNLTSTNYKNSTHADSYAEAHEFMATLCQKSKLFSRCSCDLLLSVYADHNERNHRWQQSY